MVLARKVARLERSLARLPSLTVALSGGVDSAVLLGIAARALPGRVRAATTRSAAVPTEEIAAAAAVARRFGVQHRVVDTDELEDPRYRSNAGDRCYFCRVAMYGALLDIADGPVADGLQADDVVADRPGTRAAAERGILHPLREAGLHKADVRRLARGLGLALHDKPAQPCLASRLPVGVEVTPERLALVHRAEQAVRARGFSVLRVRCEGDHGRIVVGADELARARAIAEELEAAVVAAGFATAAVDARPY
ncbi:MAG: ATP-dependent sacrificial sulfur transferase LarE [Planctomycetota bacterium]